MAKTHGSKAKVFAGGFELTRYLRKASTPMSVDTAAAECFGDTSKQRIAGLKDGKLTAEGLFSHALGTAGTELAGAADIDNYLAYALGTDGGDVPMLYGPEGDAVGKRARGILAVNTSYEVANDVADVVTVKLEAEASQGAGVEPGVFLHSAAAAEVATGNGVQVQDAGTVATTAGAALYLCVCDIAGAAPSLTVKVQHSADGTTWADLGTFTTVTAKQKAQRLVVAGTVNKYLRAQWTFAGTTTSATFVVAAARK